MRLSLFLLGAVATAFVINSSLHAETAALKLDPLQELILQNWFFDYEQAESWPKPIQIHVTFEPGPGAVIKDVKIENEDTTNRACAALQHAAARAVRISSPLPISGDVKEMTFNFDVPGMLEEAQR